MENTKFRQAAQLIASRLGYSVEAVFEALKRIGSELSDEDIKKAALSIATQVLGVEVPATPQATQEDFVLRVDIAGRYLRSAGLILDELKANLDQQHQELLSVQSEMEKRRQDVEYWGRLASVNREQAEILTKELERALRVQIRQELDKGKNIRRATNLIVWIITLILGGIIGAIIQQYLQGAKLF